jgi:hypothetical protein
VCSAICKIACTITTTQIIAGSSLQWFGIKMQRRQILIGRTNKINRYGMLGREWKRQNNIQNGKKKKEQYLEH